MLLVVDVGNSHTVLGLYDGRELRGHWRVVTANYRTGDELQILLMMLLQSIDMRPAEIRGCCVSSVVPQLNPALQQVARHAFKVEALMVEPTETESKAELDRAIAVYREIHDRAIADPAAMHTMPQHTPIRRPDEVKAARQPVLRYTGEPV